MNSIQQKYIKQLENSNEKLSNLLSKEQEANELLNKKLTRGHFFQIKEKSHSNIEVDGIYSKVLVRCRTLEAVIRYYIQILQKYKKKPVDVIKFKQKWIGIERSYFQDQYFPVISKMPDFGLPDRSNSVEYMLHDISVRSWMHTESGEPDIEAREERKMIVKALNEAGIN